MGVEDGEVGGVDGGGELVAVGAVADEGADVAFAVVGEGELHGTAEAGRCRVGGVGPAVRGAAGEGEVGLLVGAGGLRHGDV